MRKIENEFWSDSRPYYVLYIDKYFLKNIYSQIYTDFPDIGQIAYIGANTRRINKDYSVNGEQLSGEDLNKNNKKQKDNYNKNTKQDNIKKAGVSICDSKEESEIREYANIHEIKEMNNMIFYKQMLRKIAYTCKEKKNSNICHIKGRVIMYDKYKDAGDVFVNVDNNCVWLKKRGMDTTAMNMSHILGDVHVIGYILEEASESRPRIIKAIAIYT